LVDYEYDLFIAIKLCPELGIEEEEEEEEKEEEEEEEIEEDPLLIKLIKYVE